MRDLRAVTLVLAVSLLAVAATACGKKSHSGSQTPTPTTTPTPLPPVITSIVPASGPVGTAIQINGTDFGATQGTSHVDFDGLPATVDTWSDTAITMHVPNVATGARDVTVGVGAISSTPMTFTVVLPRVAYLLNSTGSGEQSVGAYYLGSSGLAQIPGSPFGTGGVNGAGYPGDMHPLAIDRLNGRLFVSNKSSIAVFDVDATTGALSAVSGSPFAVTSVTPIFLSGIDVTPDGAHVYASTYGSPKIVGFNVGSSGALTELSASPFAFGGGNNPTSLHIAPDGACAVVAADSSTRLFGYPIGAGGALGTETSIDLLDNGYGAGFGPAGVLYSTVANAGTFDGFSLDAACSFTALSGSPLVLPTNGTAQPAGFALSPDGSRAYIPYSGSTPDAIAAVDLVSGSGVITGNGSGSPFPAPDLTMGGLAAIADDGKTLFAANQDVLQPLLVAYTLDTAGVPHFASSIIPPANTYPMGLLTP